MRCHAGKVAAAQIAPLKPKELVRFLQACDLVKFARFAPPGEEAEAALAEVRKMVEKTLGTWTPATSFPAHPLEKFAGADPRLGVDDGRRHHDGARAERGRW